LLAYGEGGMVVEEADTVPLRFLPLQVNRAMQEKLDALYSGEVLLLTKALLTGDRSAFSDTLYSQLSETGVTHLTAVSGMHCAMLFSLVGLLIANRRRASLIGLALVAFFMLMVGATPSVTRACLMLSLVVLAPLAHRPGDSLTSVGVALLLILMRDPYAAASISLQLSFLSVAGLLLFADKINAFLLARFLPEGGRRPITRFVCASLSATVAATVFTAPLVAYYFDCVSLISPLTNLLCLSAVTIAFGLELVSVLLGFVWMPLAHIVAVFPTAALDYFLLVVRLLVRVPYHAVYTTNPYLVLWLVYVYAAVLLLALTKTKRTRTIAMAVVSCALTLILTASLPVLAGGGAALTAKVLDVGQGASLLLSSQGSTALLDCGSTNSWINAGSVAANEINTLGVTTLDYLILTHYHNDHANGLNTLFSRVRVRCLVIPAVEPDDADNLALQQGVISLAQRNGTEVLFVDEETCLSLGAAELTLFPPLGTSSTNEMGLSLLCSCADFDLLATGDMDSDTERLLLQSAEFPDLEVLAVGHHGSKYSTAQTFLDALTPEEAVISVGSNSYGHPADETLHRLVRSNINVYRTDRSGTVTITVFTS
jgi:competence protein ComEC